MRAQRISRARLSVISGTLSARGVKEKARRHSARRCAKTNDGMHSHLLERSRVAPGRERLEFRLPALDGTILLERIANTVGDAE